jgi:hypothetical protein
MNFGQGRESMELVIGQKAMNKRKAAKNVCYALRRLVTLGSY